MDTWGPKVHPLTRDIEPEDPLELMARQVRGDPEVMLQCLVSEFTALGHSTDDLLELFQDPGYPVLNELCQFFGPVELRRRMDDLVARTGVFRCTEVHAEADDNEASEEPELVQLSIRTCRGE